VLKPPTGADAHAIVAETASDDVAGFKLSVFMDDALIGGIGLNHRAGDIYELGYWLAKAFWGRGIATEAATGLLQHAQQVLPQTIFVAHCMKGNLASSRVLEKLGFCVTGEVEIESLSLRASMPCFEFELK